VGTDGGQSCRVGREIGVNAWVAFAIDTFLIEERTTYVDFHKELTRHFSTKI